MGSKGWGIVGFAAALLIGFFSWEWFLSPEARVSRALKGMASAAEDADAERFLSYLTEDYSDFVHRDRESLEGRVRESFERVERLNVTLSDIEVDVDAETARAQCDLVVVAVRGEERYLVVGTPFDPEKVRVELSRSSGEWKVRRVDNRF